MFNVGASSIAVPVLVVSIFLIIFSILTIVFMFSETLQSKVKRIVVESYQPFIVAGSIAFALGAIGIGIFFYSVNNKVETNLISQATEVNEENFVNKVKSVSNIEAMNKFNYEDKDELLSTLKNRGFVKANGLRYGKEVQVAVYFDGDIMKVNIETLRDTTGIQVYAYKPKS